MPKLTGPSVLGYRQIVGEAVGRFGEDHVPVFECPDCGGDLAVGGHMPNCPKLKQKQS